MHEVDAVDIVKYLKQLPKYGPGVMKRLVKTENAK